MSSDDSTIVTGAADSVITFWKDCTEEKEVERQADIQKAISKYFISLYSNDLKLTEN